MAIALGSAAKKLRLGSSAPSRIYAGSTAFWDSDAAAYVAAVEAADTQPLELGVVAAYHNFVLGCKADGIWDAIKASCILAGARTLAGALVPLRGTAPTNVNFVEGDYNRETGLVGNGSTKYLDTNRNNNADPQNSKHVATYISTLGTVGFAVFGTESGAISGSTQLAQGADIGVRLNSSASSSGLATSTGFLGASRSSSSEFVVRSGSADTTYSIASQAGSNRSINLYRRPDSDATTYINARLAYYSIGESLDLALLDTRVSALVTAIGAAI